MMLTLSTFVKERFNRILGYVYSTCMSVLHETRDSLDVENCKLGFDARKPELSTAIVLIKHTYAEIEWVIWVLVQLKLS